MLKGKLCKWTQQQNVPFTKSVTQMAYRFYEAPRIVRVSRIHKQEILSLIVFHTSTDRAKYVNSIRTRKINMETKQVN